MTGKRRVINLATISDSLGASSLNLEIRKSAKGAIGVIGGVVSVNAYSSECLELLSHSGRVTVLGDCLELSLLENRTLEIYGRITEVKLNYGKG